MTRPRMRWQLGAFSPLVLAVVLLGATAGGSALGRSSASSTLVDGTTDTITNLDPPATYDFGSSTLNYQVFQHLMDYCGPKPAAGARTRCFPAGAPRRGVAPCARASSSTTATR